MKRQFKLPFTFLLIGGIIGLLYFTGCKKADDKLRNSHSDQGTQTLGKYLSTSATNNDMLSMVLTGSGGAVGQDDENGTVYLPSYNGPSNQGGILSFATREDMEKYQDALDILEIYWNYPDVDYEETPQE